MDAVAHIINTLQPDLVALQEVDNETTRSKGLDLTSELSKRTEME
ncbi:MAG: endonuclease/exonuclease/phosphatase family protein, partial [Planctomycetota bacterium]